jgi:hypothetical protein
MKASRPAVTPQLRPKNKISLPVASSVPARGRDETIFNLNVSPARRAGRRHRQNNDDRWRCPENLVRSRSKKPDGTRASEDVLRGVGQGRAVTACAGSALPLNRKAIRWFAQIRVTLCDIKLAAGKRQRAAPARGTPRDPVPAIL